MRYRNSIVFGAVVFACAVTWATSTACSSTAPSADGSGCAGVDYAAKEWAQHKYSAEYSFHEASGYEVLVDANRLQEGAQRPVLRELVQVKWYTPWEDGEPSGAGAMYFADDAYLTSPWARTRGQPGPREDIRQAFEACVEGASWYQADDELTEMGWDPNWVTAFATLHFLTEDPEQSPQRHRAVVPLARFYTESRSENGESETHLHIGIISNRNTEWILAFREEDTTKLIEAMHALREQSNDD